MTDPGPWGAPRPAAEPEPPPRPPRAIPVSWRRLLLWVGLLVGGGVLLGSLFGAAPWAVNTPRDWAYVVMWSLAAALASRALLVVPRGEIARWAGFGAVWVGVIGVLALGYLYRAELAQAPQRLRMALNVGAPVATGQHELRVAQDASGSFVIVGQVNGKPVLFLVDTGASDTVLSPADAQRVGAPVGDLRYDKTAETANGMGYGAAWTADRLDVGGIHLGGFPVVVNKTPMSASLLGMTFLNSLASFEVRDRTLILRWREDGAGKP